MLIGPVLKLDRVTVFQSSALFKMMGEIKCKKGENSVVIDNLTRKLEKNSVRVKGTGEGKIANILIEKKYSEKIDKEKINELKKENEKLIKSQQDIGDKISNLKLQKEKKESAMETFANEFPKWYSLGKINIEAINDLDNLFHKQIDKISKDLRKLQDESAQIELKILEINAKINQLGYSTQREVNSYYQVTVILEAEKQSEMTLEVSFMVSDAYWEPFYDIVIKEDKVNIDLMANVYNRTDVDWEDISLDISTASVAPIKMDKPGPYNIDERKPIKYPAPGGRRRSIPSSSRGARMDFVAQKNLSDDLVGAVAGMTAEEPAPAPPPELTVEKASISSNFGVQVYNLNAKYTIQSDKNPKPIPLYKQELPSILQYFWSVTSPDRILCNNKIKNGKQLILPGSAKVYVEDEFIGETLLELIAPNQEFKLGERISYDVKVKKEMKEKNKSKEGAFKGKTSVSYSYEISIENLNEVEEELILYDRIPHSVSEKIKVKIGEISEEPASNVMNVLKFVLDMSQIPEKKVITYGYEAVYEKGINIRPSLP